MGSNLSHRGTTEKLFGESTVNVESLTTNKVPPQLPNAIIRAVPEHLAKTTIPPGNKYPVNECGLSHTLNQGMSFAQV